MTQNRAGSSVNRVPPLMGLRAEMPLSRRGPVPFELAGATSPESNAVRISNQMGFDCLTDDTHPLFYGKAVAILRSKLNIPGEINLTVRAPSKRIESQVVLHAVRVFDSQFCAACAQ